VATTDLATTQFICIDRWRRCTNYWCDVNCRHNPSYCPRSFCRGQAVAPPIPPPPPPAPLPVTRDPKCLAGLVGVYYSSATNRGDDQSVKGSSVCCPASCGTCGGLGCKDRPGGKDACCADHLHANSGSCKRNMPPCIGVDMSTTKTTELDAVEGAAPATTELDSDTSVATTDLATTQFICIDRWRRCTNYWCDVNCRHNPSYCPRSFCRGQAVAPPIPPPPPPAPLPVTRDPKCLAGLVGVYYSSATNRGDDQSVKGSSVCCPASCGTCGGLGCKDRPGGKDACCSDKVFEGGRECANSMAPCRFVDI